MYKIILFLLRLDNTALELDGFLKCFGISGDLALKISQAIISASKADGLGGFINPLFIETTK